MLEAYRQHEAERAAQGIPAKPLSAEQVAGLIELIQAPPAGEAEFLLELLATRVPPGVDEAAYVKAGFLSAIAKGETDCDVDGRTASMGHVDGPLLEKLSTHPYVKAKPPKEGISSVTHSAPVSLGPVRWLSLLPDGPSSALSQGCPWHR